MNFFKGINLENFSYDSYWHGRNTEIRKELLERENIFFEWIKPGSRVLDIACGNSGLLQALREKKNCDVSAFDISEEVVKKQKSVGVKAEVLDISGTNFSLDKNYDYIIASEILEHLSMPENLIKKIGKSGKLILVSVPNSAFYKYRIQVIAGRFIKQWVLHPSEHLRFWSYKDFIDWLHALDFDVLKSDSSNGFDLGPIKFYKFFPNLFGHQICYMIKSRQK